MKSDFRNIDHRAIHISATWFHGRNTHGALLRISFGSRRPLARSAGTSFLEFLRVENSPNSRTCGCDERSSRFLAPHELHGS